MKRNEIPTAPLESGQPCDACPAPAVLLLVDQGARPLPLCSLCFWPGDIDADWLAQNERCTIEGAVVTYPGPVETVTPITFVCGQCYRRPGVTMVSSYSSRRGFSVGTDCCEECARAITGKVAA